MLYSYHFQEQTCINWNGSSRMLYSYHHIIQGWEQPSAVLLPLPGAKMHQLEWEQLNAGRYYQTISRSKPASTGMGAAECCTLTIAFIRNGSSRMLYSYHFQEQTCLNWNGSNLMLYSTLTLSGSIPASTGLGAAEFCILPNLT